MKMNAPKTVTWIIAVVIGVIGILAGLGILSISGITTYAFWMVAAAFVLLALATLLKGL